MKESFTFSPMVTVTVDDSALQTLLTDVASIITDAGIAEERRGEFARRAREAVDRGRWFWVHWASEQPHTFMVSAELRELVAAFKTGRAAA